MEIRRKRAHKRALRLNRSKVLTERVINNPEVDMPREEDVIIIIIMVHLRMQPEGYGAAIYTF